MIGLDTNVLVRYLVRDDPEQAPRADRLITRETSAESPAFVSLVALCEVVWVLRGAFRMSRSQIADTIDRLLQTVELRLERSTLVAEALELYRGSEADFADCVIGLVNQGAGCGETVTIDRAAAGLAGFRAI